MRRVEGVGSPAVHGSDAIPPDGAVPVESPLIRRLYATRHWSATEALLTDDFVWHDERGKRRRAKHLKSANQRATRARVRTETACAAAWTERPPRGAPLRGLHGRLCACARQRARLSRDASWPSRCSFSTISSVCDRRHESARCPFYRGPDRRRPLTGWLQHPFARLADVRARPNSEVVPPVRFDPTPRHRVQFLRGADDRREAVRDHGWSVRVPRSLKELAARVEIAATSTKPD
jgi:hypothetical protein